MPQKIIVGDLFGGGQNSVYHTLKDDDRYDVYTFDITEPTHEHQYIVDLSQDNIVELFKNYPHPDIITSSTLCQSFSSILSMKGGGTCFGKLSPDKKHLEKRTIADFNANKAGFTANLNAEKQLFIANLGQKCIDNTIALIKAYKPKYWYIENPGSSLIGKYITLNRPDFYDPSTCFINKTRYGAYNFFAAKPTKIMSNVQMQLKNESITHWHLVTDEDGGRGGELDEPGGSMNGWFKKRVRYNPNHPSVIFAQFIASHRQKAKEQFDTKQISEAGYVSHIPTMLLEDIFNYFKFSDDGAPIKRNNPDLYDRNIDFGSMTEKEATEQLMVRDANKELTKNCHKCDCNACKQRQDLDK